MARCSEQDPKLATAGRYTILSTVVENPTRFGVRRERRFSTVYFTMCLQKNTVLYDPYDKTLPDTAARASGVALELAE